MNTASAKQFLRDAHAVDGESISAGGPSDVFFAALCMGHILKSQPVPYPLAFHEFGRPMKVDRAGAADDLWNALESLKDALGISADNSDNLLHSLARCSAPAWRREALSKIIRANALIQNNDPATDRQALELLGQAVWEKQTAEPDKFWKEQITKVWPNAA